MDTASQNAVKMLVHGKPVYSGSSETPFEMSVAVANYRCTPAWSVLVYTLKKSLIVFWSYRERARRFLRQVPRSWKRWSGCAAQVN